MPSRASVVSCFIGVGFTLVVALSGARAADIVIGTGERGGLYHQIGRVLCRIINREAAGVSCRARPTEAGDTTVSMANLANLSAAAIDVVLARSDEQNFVVTKTGRARFMDENFDHLRALFSLQAEPLTILARRDSGIRTIGDLKGRRVNIGAPGSVERAMMGLVMTAMGWKTRDFMVAEELPSTQQSLALCHDQVEAGVFVVSHPDKAVRQVLTLCDALIVDVVGAEIDQLVDAHRYFDRADIPAAFYPVGGRDARSFGVRITAMSSTDVDAETIHAIVEAVFDNVEEMKKMHPGFRMLDPSAMMSKGLTAVLHDGAMRYYKASGLM